MEYQYNKKTGKAYEGRNQAELLTAKEENGYQPFSASGLTKF